MCRDRDDAAWYLAIFIRYEADEDDEDDMCPFYVYAGSCNTCLPFNRETEKLLNTTNKPNTKYIFKGVKSYFDED